MLRGSIGARGWWRRAAIAMVVGAAAASVWVGMPSAVGQLPTPATPFPEQLVYRPTPVPDRVVLTWAGDPAHTQAVTWRTDTTVNSAQAQIAEATGGPAFESVTEDRRP